MIPTSKAEDFYLSDKTGRMPIWAVDKNSVIQTNYHFPLKN